MMSIATKHKNEASLYKQKTNLGITQSKSLTSIFACGMVRSEFL